jgi:hypothetical protein
MKAPTTKRRTNKFKIGDYVREKDGTKIGTIIHRMKNDPSLVVVKWPPEMQGFVFSEQDLD